jgi:HAD superfamily hydrolase (TIGR01509 family)
LTRKLYIFDMGGVVVQNFDVFGEIYNTLKISKEQFEKYSGDNFELLLKGKISAGQFWQFFSKRYGSPIRRDLMKTFFHPTVDREIVALITEIKHTARVVCGTNVIDSHYDYLLQRKDYDLFDKVYASNKIGIAKPDPNFYWYILEHENRVAADSYFIDDMKENVDAAGELGIKTVLFTGAAALKVIL